MALQHELYSFLTSQAALTSEIGTRVFPVVIPQGKIVPAGAAVTETGQDKPALVWRLIRMPQDPDLDGDDFVGVTTELTVWGQRYEDVDAPAKAVTDVLREAVRNAPIVIGSLTIHAATLQREEDTFDEDLLLYGRQQIWEFIGVNL
jgi:hypothetical protein